MTFIYICILALAVAATSIHRIIVVDGREALLYRGGRYVRILMAGTHWGSVGRSARWSSMSVRPTSRSLVRKS